MRLVGAAILVCSLIVAPAVQAGAPKTSVRPKPRDAVALARPDRPQVKVFYTSLVRPKPRMFTVSSRGDAVFGTVISEEIAPTQPASTKAYALASTAPVYRSPRPSPRPSGLVSTPRRMPRVQPANPVRVASTKPSAISRTGAVCGDPKIRGEVLKPIAGKLAGCGVERPVRVSSVDGVVLSQQSIMDCTTAKTLRGWVSNSLKPTIRKRGGGVKSLSVPSHYSCRTRNSKPGAKISEHGKGRAIDISSINLKDGSKITVLNGWTNRKDKKVLQKLHASACGPFGTVLGPESDRYHKDHFHFDTARYRGGAYCR